MLSPFSCPGRKFFPAARPHFVRSQCHAGLRCASVRAGPGSTTAAARTGSCAAHRKTLKKQYSCLFRDDSEFSSSRCHPDSQHFPVTLLCSSHCISVLRDSGFHERICCALGRIPTYPRQLTYAPHVVHFTHPPRPICRKVYRRDLSCPGSLCVPSPALLPLQRFNAISSCCQIRYSSGGFRASPKLCCCKCRYVRIVQTIATILLWCFGLLSVFLYWRCSCPLSASLHWRCSGFFSLPLTWLPQRLLQPCWQISPAKQRWR